MEQTSYNNFKDINFQEAPELNLGSFRVYQDKSNQSLGPSFGLSRPSLSQSSFQQRGSLIKMQAHSDSQEPVISGDQSIDLIDDH